MTGCSSDAPPAGRSLALPVLAAPKPAIRRSKMGPRRAAVLIAVHVLIAAHIAHWWITGQSVSPVEPSESMKALELGHVNAGAIFFAAAILLTLVFGRFFCGWGCHIVALQDFCGWLMKKCGVRPKPFRSRLLTFVPLILAIYMFVWPTLKREVIAPALDGVWPTVRADLNVTPFPDEGFTLALVTEGFWDTFPPIAVAIPFLLVCGFATVYFLGAKGFCTYGCPYGGFFGPADLVSPGKIVVDHAKCHQCGHCTAVCTSNVRVHDEIREYGAVVDPGCMKCMDCVSVCPNGALSFGFATPSILKGKPRKAPPRRVYDTTWTQDAVLALLMLALFFAFRGAYDVVPMLMAVAIAGIGAFIGWKFWRTLRDRDARFSVFQLKRLGRLTWAGRAFVLIAIAAGALSAHTGYVNFHRWRGESIYETLSLSKVALLTPGTPPLSEDVRAGARRALEHFGVASSFGDGGVGLVTPTIVELRRAMLHLAVGENDRAELLLSRLVESGRASDEGVADLARLKLLRNDAEGAMAICAREMQARPQSWATRELWALLMASTGRAGEALEATKAALDTIPPERFTRTAHARTRMTLARLRGMTGDPAGALAELNAAADVRPKDAIVLENLAAATAQIAGDLPGAIEFMRRAVDAEPTDLRRRFQFGQILLQAGHVDEAIAQWRELERRDPGQDERRLAIEQMLTSAGHAERVRNWNQTEPSPAAR